MKKFVSKVQRLNQRAADFRQVIEKAQPKIGGIREALSAAVGQVQKLRGEMASGDSPLRSGSDEQLVAILREIDGGTEVLAEAGVRLAEVEMDLGLNRRLIVRLDRIERVEPARLRALLSAHAEEPALKALLTALLNAEELAKTVDLKYLSYQRLTVEVGLIPSVRIGWRSEAPVVSESTGMPSAFSATALAPASIATPNAGVAGTANQEPTSMFQRRPRAASAPLNTLQVEPVQVVTPPAGSLAPVAGSPQQVTRAPGSQPAKDSRAQALDRFKKMPDLTKRTR